MDEDVLPIQLMLVFVTAGVAVHSRNNFEFERSTTA